MMPEAPHEDMAALGPPESSSGSSCAARCESAHADGVRLEWGAESRLILLLGLPSILVQGNVFFIWLYNVAWAGRNLGVTEMAGVSTANLAGNLTALSIQYGFIYALESLTSQAMGAQLHHEVGLLVQRCIICCILSLIPAYALWAVMEGLLVAIHQPPEVAALAAHFLRVYAPGLPGLVLFEISRRFLGCQDIMLAYIPITVLATWVCHPLLLTLLSHRGFGFDSVPIATAITVWLLALLTLAYIYVLKPHDPRTWTGVELRHALSRHGMAQFLRIALPGVFTMTEWWYWEFVCATIGALGEAQLASHLIAYAIVPTLVMAPIGISIAVAVRSGQLVGEGRPHHAKAVAGGACAAGVVVIAAYTLAVARSSRRIISAFSNEETSAKVIEMTVDIWPLVCAFLVLDGTYMLQFGVLRALAFQFRASICVFVALWVVGVPVTLFIAFRTSAGLPGIWAALLPIYALLNLLCAVIILRADWGAASTEAKEMAREDDALAAEHPAAERAPAMEACARAGGARPWAEDLLPEEGEGCAAPTRAPL